MEPRLACGHDPLAIAAVADGEASAEERARVEERLLTCRSCLRYWERMRWLREAFLQAAPPPSVNLTPRIMAAIEREERRRLPLRFAVALVAAILIVVGMAMTIAPADSLAESSVVADPLWLDFAGAVTEPLAVAGELDRVVVMGLSVAVAASVVLLSRLVRVSEG
ncbi:MAG: zf-HC2 domain-containing protein [Chloroflexota bacterium]|nr:zf-HC2 domain-containing protein [Dehalococcoidia bacterium]MDW8254494.1 zf-HC2 domain-containing protein [Chloroflexota bacterium]